MDYACEEAKLSATEIAEIYRNMEARGLTHVFCQACSEEMKPEQARKSSTGLIMCRPCYMCNDTEATQEEIDQALEEDFPGYLASFNEDQTVDAQENSAKSKDGTACEQRAFPTPAKNEPTPTPNK